MSIRNEKLNIGQVVSVDGAAITLEATQLRVSLEGGEEVHITVGSFVNCGGGHGDVLCVVTRAWQELVERIDPQSKGHRVLTDVKKVELVVVGTITQGFRRGVDHLPPVGSAAYFITGEAFDALLDSALNEESKNRLFPLGTRVGTGKGVARFDLNKFFGRHAAVLGTTGSGKSYTVASLAQAILKSYARPRLVIFDIHNEYGPAFQGEFSDRSSCIGWSDFHLPFWLLTFDEFVDVFTGGVLGSNQKVFLSTHLLALRQEFLGVSTKLEAEKISVDTPICFEWDELISRLEAQLEGITAKAEREPLLKVVEKMKSRRRDPRFSFLFEAGNSRQSMTIFFEKVFGLGESDVHATVLDLSGLPAEVRATAIGILCRLFFDYRYWDSSAENLPVALVLEEAHAYIPAESDAKYAIAVEAIERIAKEGRKYGLSLVVVSQRPANVSPTILSQCGTFVALRLTSDIDQARVLRLLPDTLGNQAGLLSSLRDGEAVVSGDGVTLPGRVLFDMPSPKPGSSDVSFHKAWTDGPPAEYTIAGVVERWLDQSRK
ncbi:ATP-binding protein [Uliginosibacterium sp. H3]|uniref:ATP-binding protein n=1 Tax=Uliginosibacterium silvisoli TaxID=3114758 RepID=A0ABU6K1F3_9RHOO|nr:ATP-binding protein [Uliginosibacterium sp. H3]